MTRALRAIGVALTAVVIAPAEASACLPPVGLGPSPAERAAVLERAQEKAWSEAVFVYEAEITETFMVVEPDADHPERRLGYYVRAAPVKLVKGTGRAEMLLFAYDLGPECVFGPSYSPRAGTAGDRYLFYSRNAEALTPRDVYVTFPVDALTDPVTLAAWRAGNSIGATPSHPTSNHP